jgi:hypothetical protein
MPFISENDLIQGLPNCTPEFKNLVRWFYSEFNNRSAANRTIVNVEPLFYQGLLAGTEFLTYAATKLYLCLTFDGSHTSGGFVSAAASGVQFYNENDASFYRLFNNIGGWDTVAAAFRYGINSSNHPNFYFSRFAVIGSVAIMKFIGYRITLV